MDTLFYGELTVVPWNIVKYNVFPDAKRGPELYGTEPATFYLSNLLLNFNVLVPFALFALPALAVTYRFDNKRLGERYQYANQSSPYVLLAVRLAPVYLWTAIMTAQKHKEERFMYPIYPLICFNAAVTVYLVRGWLEAVFVAVTKSPYKVREADVIAIVDGLYFMLDSSHAGLSIIPLQSVHAFGRGDVVRALHFQDNGTLEVLSLSDVGHVRLGIRGGPAPAQHDWAHCPAATLRSL